MWRELGWKRRIARCVTSRIITWPPNSCFHCKQPIIAGQKWVELVNDNRRARFHFDCLSEWRAQQEVAARRALGLPSRNTILHQCKESLSGISRQ